MISQVKITLIPPIQKLDTESGAGRVIHGVGSWEPSCSTDLLMTVGGRSTSHSLRKLLFLS